MFVAVLGEFYHACFESSFLYSALFYIHYIDQCVCYRTCLFYCNIPMWLCWLQNTHGHVSFILITRIITTNIVHPFLTYLFHCCAFGCELYIDNRIIILFFLLFSRLWHNEVQLGCASTWTELAVVRLNSGGSISNFSSIRDSFVNFGRRAAPSNMLGMFCSTTQ